MDLKKHIITGAQCTGKTSTVNALHKRGYSVIEEAARLLIEEQNRTGGDLVPWKRLFDFMLLSLLANSPSNKKPPRTFTSSIAG